MQKIATVAVLCLAAAATPSVYAGGGGSFGGYAGSVKGSVESISNGSAVAASQVSGNGFSKQFAAGESGGTASMGGSINHDGADVWTDTSQYAKTTSWGYTHGDAPGDVDGNILNGSAAYGETNTNAVSKAKFKMVEFGGFRRFGGYGH